MPCSVSIPRQTHGELPPIGSKKMAGVKWSPQSCEAGISLYLFGPGTGPGPGLGMGTGLGLGLGMVTGLGMALGTGPGMGAGT